MAARSARIGGAAALCLALIAAGCGRGAQQGTTSTPRLSGARSGQQLAPLPVNRSPRGLAPTVTFTGGRIAGTLYLLAGPSDLEADIYQITGSFGRARRVTYSSTIGFGDVSAWSSKVIVEDNRSGQGVVRLLVTDDGPPHLGPVLEDYGLAPSLGPGGRFTFSADREGSGKLTLYLGRLGSPHLNAVLQSRRDLTDVAWNSHGQLAAFIGDGIASRIILGANTASPRTITPHLRGLIDIRGGGPRGLIALTARGEIGLLDWNGHLRTIHTGWKPAAFSPDGRSLLVASTDGRRLGLMSLKTHAVVPIAALNGVATIAAWLPR